MKITLCAEEIIKEVYGTLILTIVGSDKEAEKY
jgi:hypothetical protein